MAITSVLRQSHQEWELLLINDGSIDSSKDVMSKFTDSRIRYFEQVNSGVSTARNVGLEKMRGDYFCFLDADDFLPSNSLADRLEVFKDNPDIEFADGAVNICSNDFSRKLSSWRPGFEGNPFFDLLSLSQKCFFGLSWMIKRKSGKRYRFKEGLTHGEDLLFFIELARNGGLYSYTPKIVLNYRTGHQSAMKNLAGLEQGYRRIYQEIKKMDISDKSIEAFKKKAQSIMMKSYFGNGNVRNGLKVWLDRKW